MKRMFEEPIVEVQNFDMIDVITTSLVTDEDEGDRV